jgi:PST family polysaccharide transporter
LSQSQKQESDRTEKLGGDVDETSTTDRRSRDRALVGGVAWSAMARTASQAATWAVSLVVARLLAPSDYGIVSAATAYLGLVALLTEFGLATAIVSQRNLSDEAIEQLGGFSVLLGFAAWGLTSLFAPMIATMLGVSELRRVLPVLGLATALSSLNSMPYALLQKQLRFRAQTNIEVSKALISSASLMVLAWAGAGFWALVLNEVIAVSAVCVILYLTIRYRLAIPRWRDISGSLRLSGQVLVARVAWYGYSSADVAIVSRTAGKQLLGVYSMAWNLTTLPSEKIAGMIMGVTTGVFASVQADLAEMRRYFLRISELLALVLLPATTGLALVAPELVRVILGDKWIDTVPVVQALALSATIRTLGPICSQVLVARLRAGLHMRYTLLSAVVLPVGFLLGSRHGMIGVALSWSILSPPLIGYQLFLTCREIALPFRNLAKAMIGPVVAVLIMAASVVIGRAVASNTLTDVRTMLIFLVVVGAVSYSATVLVVMRSRLESIRSLYRDRGATAKGL